ncbi:MAG: hypothetical protein QOD49_148 [Actinomycetota bacterium]|nr:hypothetical protein [Actinomycetota bacterium]
MAANGSNVTVDGATTTRRRPRTANRRSVRGANGSAAPSGVIQSAGQDLLPVLNAARGNVDGRATAITVLTPMRWWGPPLLRMLFGLTSLTGLGLGTLRRLSFIHYARWTIIDRLPPKGSPAPRERLNHSYLFFESNFNGTWDQYIDAFAAVVPSRMRVIWGSSFGFPGPLPTGPFKEYIRRNEFVANHYYTAYPEATTTMVLSSLELEARLREFIDRSARMNAGEFKRVYDRLLTSVQRCL